MIFQKSKKALPLLLITILCYACIDTTKKWKVEDAVEGPWIMDTIYYKNYNIRTCLGDNSLFFNFEKKSSLPAAGLNCGPIIRNSFDKSAEVNVLNSAIKGDSVPFRLKILTKNELFAGTYKIVFYKDAENKLLKMEIFNDRLYIMCSKALFNFDEHIELINELEYLTWPNRPKD